MNVSVKRLKIDTYSFGSDDNPYIGNSVDQPIALTDIAQLISAEIDSASKKIDLIIRGIQSGKHELNRDVLLQTIVKDGQEYENIDEPTMIFAAPYEGQDTIQHILEGFHKYKPKSEDRPQYPVDMWLVFDAGAYQNVEYLHPRHNVLARDKWRRIQPTNAGLLQIIVIN